MRLWKAEQLMLSVVIAMILVLAVVVGVVVAVLIEMKSRSWRWAINMLRLAKAGRRYVNRQIEQYNSREAST